MMLRAAYVGLVAGCAIEAVYEAASGEYWRASLMAFATIVLVLLRGELDTERGK